MVLIHGLMSSHATWNGQIDRLAVNNRVIAPDLPGNGASGKALGDYSLSAQAAAVRDLLDHLAVRSAAVVGHSLGGGVAMQFAYLFPERVDRLTLVSSGGLGREISPALRAAILPGSEYVLPVITSRPVRVVGDQLLALSDRIGVLPLSQSSRAAWRDLVSLADAETRRAFLATSRGVIDRAGRPSARSAGCGRSPIGRCSWCGGRRIASFRCPRCRRRSPNSPVPASRSSNVPGISRTWTSRTGSPRCCAEFVGTQTTADDSQTG